MQDLNITLVQTDLHWQEKEANLAMLEEKLMREPLDTDLIILPEMFTTGFTMDVESVAEPMKFHTFRWMQQMAREMRAVVTGSFIVKDKDNIYNRLLWVEPDGNFDFYDKRHLFRMANEDQYFTEGKSKLIKELKGWKICPLICYDLRFPVWSRNTENLDYDLLLFVANWPAARIQAWDTLLKARALENLSYAVGVNRVGVDGNGILYNGHSAIYSPKGSCEFFDEGQDLIVTHTLDANALINLREKFPANKDADTFQLLN